MFEPTAASCTAASTRQLHHGCIITAASSRLHHHGSFITAASSRLHHHSSNTRHHSSNTHHHSSNTRHHSSKIVNDRTLFRLIVSNLRTLCTHLNTLTLHLSITHLPPLHHPHPLNPSKPDLDDVFRYLTVSCKLLIVNYIVPLTLCIIPLEGELCSAHGFLWSIISVSHLICQPLQDEQRTCCRWIIRYLSHLATELASCTSKANILPYKGHARTTKSLGL